MDMQTREHLEEVLWYIGRGGRTEQQAFEDFADMRIYKSVHALRGWLDEQETAPPGAGPYTPTPEEQLEAWRLEHEAWPEIAAKLFHDYQSKTDDELAAMKF
jgi:hypothetical protein